MRGNRQVVRRLELEEKKGVLKWEVDALFGMKWEKVKLPEARVRKKKKLGGQFCCAGKSCRISSPSGSS